MLLHECSRTPRHVLAAIADRIQRLPKSHAAYVAAASDEARLKACSFLSSSCRRQDWLRKKSIG
jgi:hypothetical protein